MGAQPHPLSETFTFTTKACTLGAVRGGRGMAKLKQGSKGKPVEAVQTKLNRTGKAGPKLKVDGLFGPKTQAAVKTYQKFIRVKVDGVAGSTTLDALDTKPGSVSLTVDAPIVPKGSDKAEIDKIDKELKTQQDKVEALLKEFTKALTRQRQQSAAEVRNLQDSFAEYSKIAQSLKPMIDEFDFANQWNGPRAKEIATKAKAMTARLEELSKGAVSAMETLKTYVDGAKSAVAKLEHIKNDED